MWGKILDASVLILSALLSLSALIHYCFQIRGSQKNSKSSLKTDLEILNLIDKNDPNYERIKKGISERINRYAERFSPELKKVRRDWPNITFGFFGLLGFGYWTYYLLEQDKTWWAVLTGFFAVSGLISIVMGYFLPDKLTTGDDEVSPVAKKRL